tara:strand:- start:411 stop:893 length:483 start_codon:yes stop_codon:yes gene_type:complete
MSSEGKGIPYKKMDDSEDRYLSLTIPEILFIDDNISLMIDGVEFENMMPLRPSIPSSVMIVSIDFIDKIGRAFIEASYKASKNGINATATISVSEMDLYILRELCISRIDYYGHRVGLSLKNKVLKALYVKNLRRRKQENLLEQLLKDIDLGDINDTGNG